MQVKKERKYFFQQAVNGSGTKRKKISVPESKLTDKQKDVLYSQFMDVFVSLPEECQQRFFQSFLNNLQTKIETPNE